MRGGGATGSLDREPLPAVGGSRSATRARRVGGRGPRALRNAGGRGHRQRREDDDLRIPRAPSLSPRPDRGAAGELQQRSRRPSDDPQCAARRARSRHRSGDERTRRSGDPHLVDVRRSRRRDHDRARAPRGSRDSRRGRGGEALPLRRAPCRGQGVGRRRVAFRGGASRVHGPFLRERGRHLGRADRRGAGPLDLRRRDRRVRVVPALPASARPARGGTGDRDRARRAARAAPRRNCAAPRTAPARGDRTGRRDRFDPRLLQRLPDLGARRDGAARR